MMRLWLVAHRISRGQLCKLSRPTCHPHLAGMVVANPSYAGLEPQLESGLYANLTNGFYHGSVVWGFVEAMMVEGGCRVRVVKATVALNAHPGHVPAVPLGGRRPCSCSLQG